MGTYKLLAILGICLLCVWTVHGVPMRLFYPFGTESRDYVLQQGDDESSNEFPLNISIAYLNNHYKNIYINSNGHLSFDTELPDYRPTLILPIGFNVIAAYFADIDTTGAGKIFFRETNDKTLLQRASTDIQAHFRGQGTFQASSLFIATWENVGYYSGNSDKVVTFQIVIPSNGYDSFAFFLYLDNGMNWIMGNGKLSPNQFDPPAQAGFDSEDGRNLKLPNSGTTVTFVNDTNVNIPGFWMFHIGDTGEDTVGPADLNTGEVVVFPVEPGATRCLKGVQRCHVSARCIDFVEGFCCECVDTYYGNGRTCLEPGVPQRLNGKVRGQINGVTLNDLDMHTYVVTSDGRAYSAISRVPKELGTPMQTLSAIGGIIGWMFAVPTNPRSKNGYMYTGGEFNRTATVTFTYGNQTYVLNVQQTFFGHDALNNLRMETHLNGEIPPIEAGAKVTVDDHKENMRKIRPGLIMARSSRTFRVKEIAYRFIWDETIMFSECMADPDIAASDSVRLSTSRNFVFYDDANQVVRFAQSNKVGVLTGEDPCRDAAQNCAAEANCIPEGEKYRCVCRPGFYGDGGTCQDVDECVSGANACSEDARCYNVHGSFQCQCLPGFRGDGRICRREVQLCGDIMCGEHGRCVFDGTLQRPVCECSSGFAGDGVDCNPIEFGCNEADNCGPNAQCVYDEDEGRYGCECFDGFSGDGFTCEATDERSVCLRCDSNAACVMDVDRFAYRCQCNVGYTGDGFRCTVLDPCVECSPNAECSFEQTTQQYHCRCHSGFYGDGRRCEAYDCQIASICDSNAQCVADPSLGRNICRCNPGYRGDGRRCVLEECRSDEDCDVNAQCFDNNGDSVCRCNPGYRGDGLRCVLEECRSDDDCDVNAQCFGNNGDSVCRCNPGYRGDGRRCVLEECRSDEDCDVNAQCFGNNGESVCRCNPGYRGDGLRCVLEECRSDDDCDVNAQCFDSNGNSVCRCNQGYRGDGRRCVLEGCRTDGDCDSNARCIVDPRDTSRYMCRCEAGYEGDGRVCIQRVVPCNQVNNCAREAECIYDPDALSYRCQCRPEYQGDGISCQRRTDLPDCYRDSSLCDPNASCVQNVDHYVCICNQNYVGDGQTCRPYDGSGNYLIYAQGYSISSVSYSENGAGRGKMLIYVPGQLAVGVDTDCTGGHLYWTDVTGGQIRRAKLDGTNIETVITGLASPEGVAVDYISRNLYYTDSELDIIGAAKLDGTNKKTLFSEGIVNPRSIVLDPRRGVFYWTDWHREKPQIEKANMDGTGRVVLVNSDLGLPNGLTLDDRTQQLCWGDAGTKRIECMRSDGLGRRILNDQAPYPFDLTFFNNVIYWSDWEVKGIPHIHRDGGVEMNGPLSLSVGGNGRLYGITSVRDQCPRVSNACAVNNGGCRYLCLPTPSGGRSCACPDDIDPRRCNEVAVIKKRK